jgi:hypothetical protein
MRQLTFSERAAPEALGCISFIIGLQGRSASRANLDEARAEIAASLKLHPEINSLAQWRQAVPWAINPEYRALEEKTLNIGLRRAGFADECRSHLRPRGVSLTGRQITFGR